VLALGVTLGGWFAGSGLARGRAADRDSHSSLGGIRQANQGVFEILVRDEAPGLTEGSQVAKRVRVVSTIDYFLRD
jgi:hypothetical protein